MDTAPKEYITKKQSSCAKRILVEGPAVAFPFPVSIQGGRINRTRPRYGFVRPAEMRI